VIGIRDNSILTVPPLVLPEAGGWYIDPVFRTPIQRVTGPAHGSQCVHVYSKVPVLNADRTRLMLLCDWKPTVFSIDGDLATKLESSIPSYQGAPPRVYPESWRWDPTNRDVGYVLEASLPDAAPADRKQRLLRVNVQNQQVVEYRRFSDVLPGYEIEDMDRSESGVFVLRALPPGSSSLEVYVWDSGVSIQAPVHKCPLFSTDVVHSASISRCGQWVEVVLADGVQVYWRWAVVGETIDIEPDDASETSIGNHTFLGRLGLVSGRRGRNAIVSRHFDSFFRTRELIRFAKPDATDNWAISHHVSAVGPCESSVLVSTYVHSGLGAIGDGWGANELIEVAADGSWFRRLAHTRSAGLAGSLTAAGDFIKGYWSQPRAVADGDLFIWTSDLGGSDRTDVLLMRRSKDDAALALEDGLAEAAADIENLQDELTAREQERNSLAVKVAAARAALEGGS
jgi:hypothetical protein